MKGCMEMGLTLQDKSYWFFKNLMAFIIGLPFHPFYVIGLLFSQIICGIHATLKCDGSIEICFPWEWDWNFFNFDDDEWRIKE